MGIEALIHRSFLYWKNQFSRIIVFNDVLIIVITERKKDTKKKRKEKKKERERRRGNDQLNNRSRPRAFRLKFDYYRCHDRNSFMDNQVSFISTAHPVNVHYGSNSFLLFSVYTLKDLSNRLKERQLRFDESDISLGGVGGEVPSLNFDIVNTNR